MALIDKASLLMVPSTYEAGTLYNVLPSGNRAPDSTDQNSGYDQTRADFTFDRGSNAAATRVNADGLIEKYRENLLTYSNDFSQWTNSGTTEASGFEGYDGTNDAWEIEKTSASAYSSINKTLTATSGVVTISAYVKKGTLSVTSLYASGGTNPYILFSFDSATITAQRPGLIDTNVEDKGNGWYRISFTTTESIAQITLHPDWSGTNTGTIYAQDVQVEKGLVATDYLDSGATTAKAGVLIDLPRINYDANGENGALLLEPQRANLISHSEYLSASSWQNVSCTITENSTISPEGLQNATLLKASGGSASRVQDYFGAQSGSHTYSLYMKGTGTAVRLNLQTNDLGGLTLNVSESGVPTLHGQGSANTDYFINAESNGWYRVGFTFTPTGGAVNNYFQIYPDALGGNNSIYIYGCQAEAGSYSTSYIPNHGTSGGVTRAADSCSVTGVSDVIGQTEGVVFLDVDTIHNNSVTGPTKWFLEVRKDANNSFGIASGGADSAPVIRFVTAIGGVVTTESEPAGFSNSKIAIKYTASEFKIFQNGSLKVTISKNIGGYNDVEFMEGASNDLLMPLKQFILFDETLTDAECISLTS